MSSATPGVKESLELLDRLKSAVTETSAREDRLANESRLKLLAERQRREAAETERAGALEAEIAAADTALADRKAVVESRFEKRKAEISRARKTSKEQALERIETKTGSRKYELQRRLMQGERTRDAGLAAAAATIAEYRSRLATEREELDSLEQRIRNAFRGYPKFAKLLTAPFPETGPPLDETRSMTELREIITKTEADLARFRRSLLPLVFRFLPVWLLAIAAPVPPILQHFRGDWLSPGAAWGITGGLAAGIVLWILGRFLAAPAAATIANDLVKARYLQGAAQAGCEEWYKQEVERLKNDFVNDTEAIDRELKLALKAAADRRGSLREIIDDKTVRVIARNEKHRRARHERAEQVRANAIDRAHRMSLAQSAELERTSLEKEAALNADFESRWKKIETDWKSQIEPIYQTVNAVNARAAQLFPPWSADLGKQWTPPREFARSAKFAQLEVSVEKLCGTLPKEPRLALPGPAVFPLALSLTYPDAGSLFVETGGQGREQAVGGLNNIILRLLTTAPPGRLNFTIIDPVGLGQNFAGIMHLADFEEQIINNRIWTQTAQIEQRLADLNEHMEKVIQMYLRNEYDTIAEYNEAAGNIAEKYHFLVVADFPSNFSEIAAKRLMRIAGSGARCGVYTLIHWDNRLLLPQEFLLDEFSKNSVCLTAKGGEFMPTGNFVPGARLVLDPPPAPELAIDLVQKVGRASIDSSRVEVPFSHVVPPDSELWSLETTTELRVPIGRTGATKLQYLAIGKGTRQHALIAGKTGSGKSTLFHTIITNLALWCSPEQVEFYLVDFKKGVEFKCYATHHLPHARVVAIESDRDFGLSVLQRVDDELRRRGEMFRKLGVQDIPGYKRAGGTEAVPRSLLMIDEFQEFFTEDDKVSQTASVLLDRIVRQGRAFGIHVMLGSQTLGGAYTVARTTLGQMVIRIALQCNEADAYLIMDDTNSAPRLLSRPGEGIYNDAAGATDGNSPFQAVWLSDEVRDTYLEKVSRRAQESGKHYPNPVVFEGDAPAEIGENVELQTLLVAPAIIPAISPRIWLGAPNSIKGPTEAVFHRQSGSNLIIVGQREEAATAILSVALVSLSAQFAPGMVRFVLFDGTMPGSQQRAYIEKVVGMIPHPAVVARAGDVVETMNGLANELKQRTEAGDSGGLPTTFLVFNGLQKFNKLRHEDDFGFSSSDTKPPGAQLNDLVCEGARLGIHVIAACDTYNNVNRFISRKALTEFETRVLFQMSAADSASLIDSPKAGGLGLHRALLYNEAEGNLEVFRPYAPPSGEWLDHTAQDLARLVVKT